MDTKLVRVHLGPRTMAQIEEWAISMCTKHDYGSRVESGEVAGVKVAGVKIERHRASHEAIGFRYLRRRY